MQATAHRRISLHCLYVNGIGSVSSNWDKICADHESELPRIREFKPGSFNLKLIDPQSYTPPGDSEFKDTAKRSGRIFCSGPDVGQHIAPRAKVVEMNGIAVEAWIYRGGLTDVSLELLSQPLKSLLGVVANTPVDVVILEHERSWLTQI
jgi:hypothetical protein